MGSEKENDFVSEPAGQRDSVAVESTFGNPAMLYQQGLDQGLLRG